jgi:hypothetical protein
VSANAAIRTEGTVDGVDVTIDGSIAARNIPAPDAETVDLAQAVAGLFPGVRFTLTAAYPDFQSVALQWEDGPTVATVTARFREKMRTEHRWNTIGSDDRDRPCLAAGGVLTARFDRWMTLTTAARAGVRLLREQCSIDDLPASIAAVTLPDGPVDPVDECAAGLIVTLDGVTPERAIPQKSAGDVVKGGILAQGGKEQLFDTARLLAR